MRRIVQEVGLDQRLGEQVPLHLVFRDEQGNNVRLGELVKDRPVVLNLVYYRCPMLCTQVLNGLLRSSQAVPLVIGRDYDIVSVSIDPRETPRIAAAKKKEYVKKYHRPGAETGWHFLTGDQPSIAALAKSVGYRYQYDPASGQYAHASGIVLLTPEGKISRYFYGIDYAPGDLRLGLVESSASRIGSLADQVLLLCYHYDPATGKYGFVIHGALQLAGTATMLGLGGFLFVMFRQERRRSLLARPLTHPEGHPLSHGERGSGGARNPPSDCGRPLTRPLATLSPVFAEGRRPEESGSNAKTGERDTNQAVLPDDKL